MTQKKKIVWSIVISVGMLAFSYWVQNLNFPLPISGEKALITTYEMTRNWLRPHLNERNDVLAINVSRNKQLVYNEDSTLTSAVTDRRLLLKLLKYLEKKDDYRYIILDIGFSKYYKTNIDSTLFSTICRMRDIVVFQNPEDHLPNKRLIKKAGIAGYYATPTESDFVKYPYMGSMALKMYEDCTKQSVKKCGPIYHDGWHLARSSVILDYNYIPLDFYDLGCCWNKMEGSSTLMIDIWKSTGKYILIGAFEDEDIHSTHIGPMPGIAINFNAFLALQKKHHHVSITLGIILLFVFFTLSYLIFSQRELCKSLATIHFSSTRWIRVLQRILMLVCSWIGFTMVLSVICLLTYLCIDEVYDILATSTLFGIFNVMVKLYNIIAYDDYY